MQLGRSSLYVFSCSQQLGWSNASLFACSYCRLLEVFSSIVLRGVSRIACLVASKVEVHRKGAGKGAPGPEDRACAKRGHIRSARLTCTADQYLQHFLQILPSVIQMGESASIRRLISESKDGQSDTSNQRVPRTNRRPDRPAR
jgi:hypothetical protein